MSNYSKTFIDLSVDQQEAAIIRAKSYYNDNKSRIDLLIDIKMRVMVPSQESCLQGPQTWTAENWAWFLDNTI